MTGLYFLACAELVLCIYSLTEAKIDFINPSSFFVCVFSFSSIIAALYCHNWDQVNTYEWKATWIILLGNILVLILGILVKRCVPKRNRNNGNFGREILKISMAKLLFIIAIDIIIVFLVYRYVRGIAIKYGNVSGGVLSIISSTYRDVYGHSNVVATEDQMSSLLRYSIYFLQATAYVFLYPFVYNLLIKKGKNINNALCIVPTVLFLVYGIICGARADILKVFISSFVMYYVFYMKTGGWSKKNTKKLLKTGIKIAAVIFTIFFLTSVIVGRSAIGDSIIGSFALQIAGYAGAPIVHFSQYLQNPTLTVTPGEETLSTLYTFLQNHGFLSINSIKHLEYQRLRGGIYGNIYTFFRRPLHDFGVGGLFLFVIIFAVVMNYYYYRYIRYPSYRNKDKFGINLICYSILFQWVAYSSIEQIGGEFLSVSFIIRILFVCIVYEFTFRIRVKQNNYGIKKL